MARPVPIPAELMQRLAALDGVCDFELVRRDREDDRFVARKGSRVVHRRVWVVVIRPRGLMQQPVCVEHVTLRRALELAIPQAEKRWGSHPCDPLALQGGEPAR